MCMETLQKAPDVNVVSLGPGLSHTTLARVSRIHSAGKFLNKYPSERTTQRNVVRVEDAAKQRTCINSSEGAEQANMVAL